MVSRWSIGREKTRRIGRLQSLRHCEGPRSGSRAAEHAAEDLVNLREMKIQVEVGGELGVAEMLANVGVSLEQRQEIAFAAPGFHGVTLNQAIGVLARDSLLRQRKQNALGVNEAAEAVEIFLHVVGIDDQLVDDPGE